MISTILSMLSSIALIFLSMKVYNKLTMGLCYCKNFMSGKVVVITGANGGIGYETAQELARRGAKVILACRDERKGREAVEAIVKTRKNKSVRFEHLDLGSLSSIRKFVDDFQRKEARLDVLINNAGCFTGGKKTGDGIVKNMQVNHFGPFLLTLLLVPMLRKSTPSRIINVTSALHKYGTIERINTEGAYGTFQGYCNSKLCNVLFTKELSKRLTDTGVVVNCLHPGYVNTSHYTYSPLLEKLRNLVLNTFFKSPRDGAQTSIYLAVSDDCYDVTGKYYADCEVTATAKGDDEAAAARLWDISTELVQLKAEEMI